MPSEKKIEVTDPGLIRFAEWFRKNYPGPDTVIHKPDWHSPKIYRAALTAAEQAEPAPAARSGAVKVKPLEWVRGWMNAEAQTDIGLYQIAYRRDGSFEWCFGIKKEWASSWDAAKEAAQADYEKRILASLEPAEPEVMCVGCEGKPSLGNSPCAVCGKQAAEPAADAEPVILSEKSFTEIMGWVDNPPEPTEKLKEIYQAYLYNKSKSGNTHPPESRLREALEAMLIPFEDSNCRHDHHGYCQEHFLEEDCCVAKARAALAQEDGR